MFTSDKQVILALTQDLNEVSYLHKKDPKMFHQVNIVILCMGITGSFSSNYVVIWAA